LWNDSDSRSQQGETDFGDVDFVDEDFSVVEFRQTEQRAEQRRFAGAGSTDDADLFAGQSFEGKTAQNLLTKFKYSISEQ
jgi:hypothetical protein